MLQLTYTEPGVTFCHDRHNDGRERITVEWDQQKTVTYRNHDTLTRESYVKGKLHCDFGPAIYRRHGDIEWASYRYYGIEVSNMTECSFPFGFRNALIYRMYDVQKPHVVYVGSTKHSLANRIFGHKNAKDRYRVHKYFDRHGWDRMRYDVLEYFPCQSTEELHARECWWMIGMDAELNVVFPVKDEVLDRYLALWTADGRITPNQNIRCACGQEYNSPDWKYHPMLGTRLKLRALYESKFGPIPTENHEEHMRRKLMNRLLEL